MRQCRTVTRRQKHMRVSWQWTPMTPRPGNILAPGVRFRAIQMRLFPPTSGRFRLTLIVLPPVSAWRKPILKQNAMKRREPPTRASLTMRTNWSLTTWPRPMPDLLIHTTAWNATMMLSRPARLFWSSLRMTRKAITSWLPPMMLGRYEEAIENYENAIDSDPLNAD